MCKVALMRATFIDSQLSETHTSLTQTDFVDHVKNHAQTYSIEV